MSMRASPRTAFLKVAPAAFSSTDPLKVPAPIEGQICKAAVRASSTVGGHAVGAKDVAADTQVIRCVWRARTRVLPEPQRIKSIHPTQCAAVRARVLASASLPGGALNTASAGDTRVRVPFQASSWASADVRSSRGTPLHLDTVSLAD